jgi:uncharacterized protein GlcG (DUF336 family)
MIKHWALSARTKGRRFAGLMMAGATALSLACGPARAEGPLLVPRTGIGKEFLSATDVGRIIGQVVQEAQARGRPATIAVVDRMGAVLAVYRMTGAPTALPVESNPKGTNAKVLVDGLSGASTVTIQGKTYSIVPTEMEALAKAITAAYLSTSHGNAFTTRTASQIVQDHFNPGTMGAPSGPLYGVQFSSLPCSDLMVRFDPTVQATLTQGPHRSPLGLAGDPGGLPLYKNGELVGGLGVKAEGPYRVDENIYNNDYSTDEIEALAGTFGYMAPAGIRADQITAGGLTLRFSDAQPSDWLRNPANATPYGRLPASAGALLHVRGYYEPLVASHPLGLRTGSRYGTTRAGLVQDTTNTINGTKRPYLLVDPKSHVRYPATAGSGIPGALSRYEALQLLRAAYASGIITRAQIRNPAGSPMAVTISVVDTNGNILGIATIPDAPVFGIDVSLQKARSAVLMSSAYGDAALQSAQANTSPVPGVLPTPDIARFSRATTNFFGTQAFSGGYAWSARAIGNIARDTYPDGIDTTPGGPLSLGQPLTTPFSDGLQLNLVLNNIIQHIGFVAGIPVTLQGKTIPVPDTAAYCTQLPAPPTSSTGRPVLSNGLQIFPGGIPVYRGNQLVGAIGVSGDGVDQDDMTAFLGVYNAGHGLRTGIGEAPFNIRASKLYGNGAAPHYVNCPYAPYIGSNSQNLCIGK